MIYYVDVWLSVENTFPFDDWLHAEGEQVESISGGYFESQILKIAFRKSFLLRFCLYGTLLQGPALYCWMRVANKMWVKNCMPFKFTFVLSLIRLQVASLWHSIIVSQGIHRWELLIDSAINFTSFSNCPSEQVAFDPFSIGVFLYSMSLLEGKTREEAYTEVSFFGVICPSYQSIIVNQTIFSCRFGRRFRSPANLFRSTQSASFTG